MQALPNVPQLVIGKLVEPRLGLGCVWIGRSDQIDDLRRPGDRSVAQHGIGMQHNGYRTDIDLQSLRDLRTFGLQRIEIAARQRIGRRGIDQPEMRTSQLPPPDARGLIAKRIILPVRGKRQKQHRGGKCGGPKQTILRRLHSDCNTRYNLLPRDNPFCEAGRHSGGPVGYSCPAALHRTYNL